MARAAEAGACGCRTAPPAVHSASPRGPCEGIPGLKRRKQGWRPGAHGCKGQWLAGVVTTYGGPACTWCGSVAASAWQEWFPPATVHLTWPRGFSCFRQWRCLVREAARYQRIQLQRRCGWFAWRAWSASAAGVGPRVGRRRLPGQWEASSFEGNCWWSGRMRHCCYCSPPEPPFS